MQFELFSFHIGCMYAFSQQSMSHLFILGSLVYVLGLAYVLVGVVCVLVCLLVFFLFGIRDNLS